MHDDLGLIPDDEPTDDSTTTSDAGVSDEK